MRDIARRADAGTGSSRITALTGKWKTLHTQASDLARLAQLSPEPFAGDLAAFPDRLAHAQSWRLDLALQGVEDIEAMMKPGLAALAKLRERGARANAPALALWREFHTARGALLALAPR